MSRYIQVATTLPSEDKARHLARDLINRRLAACVQVSGPITSTYRWQDHVEESQEWICTAKTRADIFSRISQAISELHPYELPEIIATAIIDISSSYAQWLDQQVD
jgi:periplasmic divalent cation tolerance protein